MMATAAAPGQQGIRELLENLVRRIRRLEQPTFISLGNYRITQNEAGDLVAIHVPTSTVTTLAQPPVVEE